MSGEFTPNFQAAEQASTFEQDRARLLLEMEAFGGEAAVIERIGLGVDELAVRGTYGQFEGRLWDAVVDSFTPPEQRPPGVVCPVGDGLQRAKQEHGMEGVHKQMMGLGMMAPDFDMKISDRTVAANRVIDEKKKNIS